MASPAPVESGPPAVGLRATPAIVISSLVVPSIAITPCLWVAVAARAAGGPGLTAQAVALAGLLLSLAGAGVTRAHSYACGEAVAAARGHQIISFGLCVIGAGLAALSAAVIAPAHLALVTVAVTAASGLVMAGLAAGRRRVALAGVIAVNLAWSADLVLLAAVALRALVPGA
jgi:hypothetical protein